MNFNKWISCLMVVLCVQWADKSIIAQVPVSENISLEGSLFKKAELFSDLADYDSALVYFNKALNFYLRIDHVEGQIRSRLELAENLLPFSKYKKALAHINEALKLSQQQFGENHLLTAKCYCEKGYFEGILNSYKKGIENCDKGIEIYKYLSIAEKSPEITKCIFNKGRIYNDHSFAEEALACLDSAKNNYEGLSGNSHQELITIYQMLGGMQYFYKNDTINYIGKALDLSKSLYGEYHSRTIGSYVLMSQGYIGSNPDKRDSLLQRALQISLDRYGSLHPVTNLVNKRLVLNKIMTGIEPSTEKLILETLGVTEKIYGENSPELALLHSNYSDYYYNAGNFKKAIQQEQKALDVTRMYFGEHHKNTAKNYGYLVSKYMGTGNYKMALASAKKELGIFHELYGSAHLSIAESQLNLGRAFFVTGDYNKALFFYNISDSIYQSMKVKEYYNVGFLYGSLSFIYSLKNDYDKAEIYIEKSHAIFKKNPGGLGHLFLTSLNSLALYYENRGNFDKSLIKYQTALEWYRQTQGDYGLDVIRMNNKIANLKIKKKEWDKARTSLHYSLSLLEEVVPRNLQLMAETYSLLGKACIGEQNYDEAISYLDNSASLFLKTDAINIGDCYRLKGKVFRQKEEYETAIKYYQKALNLYKNLFTENSEINSMLALSYMEIGELFHQQKKQDSALVYVQRGIDMVSSSNVSEEELKTISHYGSLLMGLRSKARILLVKEGRNLSQSNFDTALSCYDYAMKFIDKIRNDYDSDESKIVLGENQNGLYREAVEVNYRAYHKTKQQQYLHSAFSISEKNRAAVLRSQFNQIGSVIKNKITVSILNDEKKLMDSIQLNKISFYKIQNLVDKNKKQLEITSDPEKIDSLESIMRIAEKYLNKLVNDIFDQKRKLEAVRNSLKEDHRDYFNSKYNNQVVSVDTFQQNVLTDEELLLEYMLTDTSIFIFAISNSDFNVYKIPRPDSLDQWVADFRRGISDYDLIRKDTRQSKKLYLSTAYQLYQLLLEKPLESVSPSINKIIIVADGLLHRLNFGVLLRRLPDRPRRFRFRDLDYVLRDYAFSYGYSATILHQTAKRPISGVPSEDLFGGFAASYGKAAVAGNRPQKKKNSELEPIYEMPLDSFDLIAEEYRDLPGAKKELRAIQKLFPNKSQIWLGPAATEAHFKKHAPRFRLLHLSTHGILDGAEPAFSKLPFTTGADDAEDGNLHVAEIYNLDLNAQLTVLSACQSGYYSNVRQGEGMITLARAFAYAGCPSLLMSQWEVHDDKTADLMIVFYQNLIKEAQSKDRSLQKAQLQLLDHAENSKFEHPFFWAGFVLTGDRRAIQH
ncbi:MAG: CHAT domain-containing tetratricopeptide repeat protein [Bacteroidota bacterium]